MTNAIFNFQSQVSAIPVFSCKFFLKGLAILKFSDVRENLFTLDSVPWNNQTWGSSWRSKNCGFVLLYLISIRINRFFRPDAMLFSFEVTASPFICISKGKT